MSYTFAAPTRPVLLSIWPPRSRATTCTPARARVTAARKLLLDAALLASVILSVLALLTTPELLFLQKAAGFAPDGSGISFTGAKTFLENIQKGLGPLVIPASVVGLSVGAGGVISGQEWGKRVLNGALAGAVIVFLGPSILQ
jgi:hypothetical protein